MVDELSKVRFHVTQAGASNTPKGMWKCIPCMVLRENKKKMQTYEVKIMKDSHVPVEIIT